MDEEEDPVFKKTLESAKKGFSNSIVFVGNHYLAKGDYRNARFWFDRALLQRHPVAAYQIGWMIMHGLGTDPDYNLAKECFLGLTELTPGTNLEVAYYPLYCCLKHLGEHESAQDILERGDRNGASDCTRFLGCQAFKAGNREKAYEYLYKAAKAGDHYSMYYVSIFPGRVKDISFLTKSAEGYFRGAELVGHRIIRGQQIGTCEDAREHFRRALNLAPSDFENLFFLEALVWWMDFWVGKGDFSEYWLSEPDLCSPVEDGYRAMDLKNFVEAREKFNTGLILNEREGECHLNLGFLNLFGLGGERDLVRAHQYLGAATISFSRDVEENLFLNEMIINIRERLELDPGNWEALRRVYTEEGNLIKVKELETKMVSGTEMDTF